MSRGRIRCTKRSGLGWLGAAVTPWVVAVGVLVSFTGKLLSTTKAGFEAMNAALLTRLNKVSVADPRQGAFAVSGQLDQHDIGLQFVEHAHDRARRAGAVMPNAHQVNDR